MSPTFKLLYLKGLHKECAKPICEINQQNSELGQIMKQSNKLTDATTEIIKICQMLVSEGKSPTVALVKSKLSIKHPIPVVISGIKAYQANPNVSHSTNNELGNISDKSLKYDESKNLELRVAELERQVAELIAIINKVT